MKKQVLTLAFSPCPNDTFIFDAMVHNKIDTEDLNFQVVFGDVEELNRQALQSSYDITKLSYHAYAYCLNEYILLDSGSALGNNCGPLLISKRKFTSSEINNLTIAIPGKYTTANFLLSIAFPQAKNKIEMLFSDIENAVLEDKIEAGLIIHENRFTYHERGLEKIIDLGEYWENCTSSPIPLGGIVIKREISETIKQKVNRVLKRSIEYAFRNPSSSSEFVKENAQEMDIEVLKKHINLYVNNFTLDLGIEGKKAIASMFDLALKKGIIPEIKNSLFL